MEKLQNYKIAVIVFSATRNHGLEVANKALNDKLVENYYQNGRVTTILHLIYMNYIKMFPETIQKLVIAALINNEEDFTFHMRILNEELKVKIEEKAKIEATSKK